MSERIFGELPAVDPELVELLNKSHFQIRTEKATGLQESKTQNNVAELSVATALNALSTYCHKANQHFWHNPATGERLTNRNKGEMFMLMVSEISEAMEGERKNLMDDKLPHRKMAEVELADAIIRIMDYAGAYNLDIGGALVEKMKYNETREDHTNAARLQANGKKW